jgi:hypothetical protein
VGAGELGQGQVALKLLRLFCEAVSAGVFRPNFNFITTFFF